MPEERATVETVKEARQGVTGHNARVVLIVSCALAIVAMGIAAAGVAVGAAATHPSGYAYAAPAAGPVVAAVPEPAAGCYFTNSRIRGVWHRVQVCD
jgi:hypothetical protein